MQSFHRLSTLYTVTFLCLSFFSIAFADTHSTSFQPDYALRITSSNIQIDCTTRLSTLVNGSSPGPTLYLKEGQTTWVRVYNDMKDENTTMHWHGLTQRTAPFSDGSPLASQWPIPAGSFFDYEVRPEVGDAGTYFYHSHVGFQEVTAAGALIVEDAGAPPYQYDDDLIVFLADHYQATDDEVVSGLTSNPIRWPGTSTAILINGQSGKSASGSDVSCVPYVYNVSPGKTYRVRVIGGTADSLVSMGVEGQSTLSIIEADGHYTKSWDTDHIQAGPGQRFSFLLKTDPKATGTQWLQFESREPSGLTSYALLSYANAKPPTSLPSHPPVSLPQQVNTWAEYALQPLSANGFPSASEVTRTVSITLSQVLNGTFKWAQNGLPWTTSSVPTPYLVDIYKNGQAAIPDYDAAMANYGWDPKTLAFPAKKGEVLEIVWTNDNSGGNGPEAGFTVHPFHAHGGHYYDLGAGPGTYDAAANEARLNGFTPALRDTTYLYTYAAGGANSKRAGGDRSRDEGPGPGTNPAHTDNGHGRQIGGTPPSSPNGWRAWRVRVTDPGVWLIHCHIVPHMIMGMQTVWVFGDAAEIQAIAEPYVSGYLDFGGSAYGSKEVDPLVNEFFGR